VLTLKPECKGYSKMYSEVSTRPVPDPVAMRRHISTLVSRFAAVYEAISIPVSEHMRTDIHCGNSES